ncbi:Ff.00g080110.m01.CDS01 [Fusarium sp. VM40]|nr:Ff.00g080110.m01.CDS01 [Fusarium sp. VM40]
MHLDLPNEVLSHIFSFILTDKQKHHLSEDWLIDTWSVRLVCRQWNDLATKHLFHTLTLWHNVNTIEDEFSSWHHLLDSPAIRAAARCVAIETASPEDYGGCDISAWPESWIEEGEFPEFISAIDRIAELPNLNALEVRFQGLCKGREPQEEEFPNSQGPQPEPSITRIQTLEAVIKAMRKRAESPNMSIICELVLDNLQNMPLEKDLTDGLLENIQRLHIFMTRESHSRPDVYLPEMREFEPYLEKTLLPTVADRLVELTLSGFGWGAIPGTFNPHNSGISLPRLKFLTLDGYRVIQPGQVEWILHQKTLTSLHFHNCTIASHCLVLQPEFSFWDVSLEGWKWVAEVPAEEELERYERQPIPHRPYSKQLKPGWYINTMRWDTVFDDIREKLPQLKDFRYDRKSRFVFFRHYELDVHAEALVNRYLAFAQRWLELPVDYFTVGCHHVQENMLGKPEELLALTEPADRQALNRLLQTTMERRYGRKV